MFKYIFWCIYRKRSVVTLYSKKYFWLLQLQMLQLCFCPLYFLSNQLTTKANIKLALT